MKTNLIAGLDIGGGKITAVAAHYDGQSNSLRIISGVSVPCKGLKGGMVSDIRETSAAAADVINYLEEKTDKDLTALYVAVRGEHLESFTNHGTYNISRADKEITPDDIEQAVLNARSIPIKNDNEIISVIPQGFSIDRQRGISNPEGMEGSLLEVDVHITTGLSSSLNNLNKTLTRPGFRIDGTFYGLMCLADSVLTQEEKDIGAMLIDLGGETMSIGIYVDGALRFSRDLPFGCDLITRDIAYALHTPKSAAQEIKEKHGVCFPAFLSDEGDIAVPSLDGKTVHNVKKSFLLDIIQPRVQDLFEQVKICVDKSGFEDLAAVGILTGGGSLMPGITEQCSQSVGLKNVRRGLVQRDVISGDEQYFEPLYSTAVSLAVYAARRDLLAGGHSGRKHGQSSKSPIIRFINMVKNLELFGG
ncbi:MAG: cell division protein FtsA [Elusimicrobiota bacterium]|jgi:cell division protein FtsA|nr:cell division protein FtsA [Elusimicrobiota bacterium]